MAGKIQGKPSGGKLKLKNNLRHVMGEELITHLGTKYYDQSGEGTRGSGWWR